MPSSSRPEDYFAEKSEISHALRRLAAAKSCAKPDVKTIMMDTIIEHPRGGSHFLKPNAAKNGWPARNYYVPTPFKSKNEALK